MQKKILYISMEVKIREYHAKLLFTLYALRRGYQVVFGAKSPMNRCLQSMPAGIFIGTGVTKALGEDPLKAKELGHKAVSFDEEGLAYINLEQFIDKRINTDTIGSIDYFFTWGDFHNSLVQKKDPSLTNFSPVGNMRFELLKEKYHSIYTETVQKLKKQYGDFILINTNLKVFNHISGQEKLFESLRSVSMIKDGEDEAFYKDRYAHQKEIFESYQALVAYLAPKLGTVNIVIRPHSSENKATWEALKLPNVYVETTGNVVPWILASRAVIQKNCTTATETVYSGRPVITYSVKFDPRFDNEISNGVGKTCSNPDEVWETLSRWINLPGTAVNDNAAAEIEEQLKTDREFLRRYVSSMEPCECTASAILDILDKIQSLPHEDNGSSFLPKRSLTSIVAYLKEKASAALRKNSPKYKLKQQKFPNLTKSELKNDIKRFSQTIGIPADSVKITKLDENLYHLKAGNAVVPESTYEA